MSVGLMALLDDIAALAKVAAASIDDVAGQAVKAGTKAAGVVIDDTAVTPRYLTDFSPARELPIIGRIALGSLKNKLLILLPAALALSLLLPQAITPLLMIGGAYLCYEGAEKIYELLLPHGAQAHEAKLETVTVDTKSFEDQKIAGAIKTDFILSAEIMAITLAAIPGDNTLKQAIILAVVGIGITAAVYGVVALIVKADDLGLALAHLSPTSSAAAPIRMTGRAIVRTMPYLLQRVGNYRHCSDDLGWRWHHSSWRSRRMALAGQRMRSMMRVQPWHVRFPLRRRSLPGWWKLRELAWPASASDCWLFR